MKKGVIFDMDGVISDTQHLHASTESQALADLHGLKILPNAITERFAAFCGLILDNQGGDKEL